MPGYRAHDWINMKTLKPIYSIQASLGKNQWAHVCSGPKPLFFSTKKARDQTLDRLNTKET